MNDENNQESEKKVSKVYITKKNYQISPDLLSSSEKEACSEGATTIHCHYISPEKYMNGGWINIAKTTFLLNKEDNRMLSMIQVNNIPISPEKHYFKKANQKFAFTLFFPLLPDNWKFFSLIEITNEPSPVMIHEIERNKTGIYNVNII
jgi:hypothetical protein